MDLRNRCNESSVNAKISFNQLQCYNFVYGYCTIIFVQKLNVHRGVQRNTIMFIHNCASCYYGAWNFEFYTKTIANCLTYLEDKC